MVKIINLEQVKDIIAEIPKKKKVLVGGCFDLFHYGHLVFLRKAKLTGDFLIIALESDEFIKKKKKREPIHDQNQRAEILSSISVVDLIIKLPLLKSDRDYLKLVKTISPKIIATTEGDPLMEKKKKQIRVVKGNLKVVSNLIQGFSTNKIIKLLQLET